MNYHNLPSKQGLYDPAYEHDACGVGFVCNIKGEKTRDIITQSLNVLNRLSHRGAVGADPNTGDGAGILIQIPHEFFQKSVQKLKVELPPPGEYATGLIFLPRNKDERLFCKQLFSKVIHEQGQSLLGWRVVPVNSSVLGKTAREAEPAIEQVFIAKSKDCRTQTDFERKLYIIRKQVETSIRAGNLRERASFYITNISSRTFSYKGLLMPRQLENFFLDLKDETMKSALCIVHSRYSTNTFPTWDLSQPFRFLAHNGEINTLRGNINWMRAREGLLESDLFGKDIEKIKPVIVPGGSDSAAIDNVFELLVLAGRSLPHAVAMLIPSAWENNIFLSEKVKSFYNYHACFMEPWDGPAAIAFTDGIRVGAVLDRNGLRPARYVVTKSDFLVMASEVGVLDIPPSEVAVSGRIEPGEIFFIDTQEGRIVHDDEIKETLATQHPYDVWLGKHLLDLEKISLPEMLKKTQKNILISLKAFGYTREDLKVILKPMAETGQEPTGSMGNDAPLAVLSKKPQLLYNYFKQLFAQVTNPPIDPIREDIVMSLESFIGPQKNILGESPEHCRKVRVKKPILTNEQLEKIRNIKEKSFKTKIISILFKSDDEHDFLKTIERICAEAELAIKEKYGFIILSDRNVNPRQAAIPALLITGAVHHYLVKRALRTRIGIIIESGEPREVHHFALLFGYGADCVNPYLAYESLELLIKDKFLDVDRETAIANYRNALDKGLKKVLSRIGISTLQSYRGAQIFEALGLNQEVIERCFSGTVSRIGGAGLRDIARETISTHRGAYPEREGGNSLLATGGIYKWERDGEFHLWNPETISALQDSTRTNSYSKYKEFSQMINDQSKNPTTLRSLFEFKETAPISVDEVESEREILKRFATGAMSYGSISRSAHETLALAMNRIKGKSNTGEGGEDHSRFIPLSNGDSKRSSIKQVASGRFGVTANYLMNADELQIKIAQGAKPGEGGQLPGHKVSVSIAKTRYTIPGVTLISPPPHHDIYSIEDLAQLIFDLKNVNPKARVSVKLVSEIGVGTIAAGVAKGHADMILISGGDGGTGASPRSSIRHAGLPWELGVSETHQTLMLNGLRSRVRLQTDGQMRTGKDVAIAALLGAEEFGFCTAVLIVMGCVMLRHCHLNNCALGIATQDKVLEKRFKGKPEYVENYFRFVVRELREIMAKLGIRTVDALIGRTDMLKLNSAFLPIKAKGLDCSKIFYKPEISFSSKNTPYRAEVKKHRVYDVLDRKIIDFTRLALNNAEPIKFKMKINNTNRAVGAMLSGEVSKLYREKGLPDGTITIRFKGVAGQSFGAWLARGITFELEGLANDYVGKGISGGKIVIYPDKLSEYESSENIIIGNTAFYGAIKGQAYISGIAGERFCIRNSGLLSVVEGVGDHGCEYMTGGRVVVLGRTGRNFAAGMSGGIAYVYDIDNQFKSKCNMEMVLLGGLEKEDEATVYTLVKNHYKFTKSSLAKKILDDFTRQCNKFIKVIPLEYKRILEGKKGEEKILVEVSDG